MWTIITTSPEETAVLGVTLGRLVQPGDVLCLYGDLGAGKTALSKALAQGLEVADHVTSPTYTLINEYQGRIPFYHLDVYRLCDPDEAYDLGLEEYFYGPGVTVIEWPSRIEEMLPAGRLEIMVERVIDGENHRQITFKPQGDRYRQLVEELKAQCMF